MTYAEQLSHPKWIEKRTQIVKRDQYKCKNCNNISLLPDLKIGYVDSFILQYASQKLFNLKSLTENITVRCFISNELMRMLPDSGLIIYYQDLDENAIKYIYAIRLMLSKEHQEYLQKHEDLRVDYYKYSEPKYDWQHQILKTPKEVLAYHRNNTLNEILYQNPIQQIEISHNDYAHINWIFSKGLNVHHTYYKSDTLAWEYPKESLITFCQPCHLKLHTNNKILHYNENNEQIGTLTPCTRCAGAGELPEYRHIDFGICYACKGARYIEFVL